jgi:hypothetical protein
MSKEYINSFSLISVLGARRNPLIFAVLSDDCPQHTYLKVFISIIFCFSTT